MTDAVLEKLLAERAQFIARLAELVACPSVSTDPAYADGIKVVEWLRDYTAVGAKTHSGIWRDLAVRKRKTEAEAQLMIMPKLAAQQGIATPALTALGRLIKDIEEGRREQSPESFNALLDAIA